MMWGLGDDKSYYQYVELWIDAKRFTVTPYTKSDCAVLMSGHLIDRITQYNQVCDYTLVTKIAQRIKKTPEPYHAELFKTKHLMLPEGCILGKASATYRDDYQYDNDDDNLIPCFVCETFIPADKLDGLKLEHWKDSYA